MIMLLGRDAGGLGSAGDANESVLVIWRLE